MIRLRDLRGGKTQTYIAQKLNINRQTYCNYENGLRQMDYDTLIKISKYYHVTIDYLLGASDTPYGKKANYEIELAPEAEDERKMLNLYRQVKQNGGEKAVISFLEALESAMNKKD